MRKLVAASLLSAAFCLFAVAKDAHATVTFSIVFTSTTGLGSVGTDTMFAVAGDVLGIEVRMTADEALAGHSVSLRFDTDLLNELNLLGQGEWAGISFGAMPTQYAPLDPGVMGTAESTAVSAGRIDSFESVVLTGPLFLPAGSYVIGTARFSVNANVSADGHDLFLGLFNLSVDGVFDSSYLPLPTSSLIFHGATVNTGIPEPGTALLLGLGLVGFALWQGAIRG